MINAATPTLLTGKDLTELTIAIRHRIAVVKLRIESDPLGGMNTDKQALQRLESIYNRMLSGEVHLVSEK